MDNNSFMFPVPDDRAGLPTTNDEQGSDESTSSGTNGLLPLEHEFGIKLPFPYKLHKMLELAGDRGYSDIISWLPNGTAFRVHKRDKLLEAMVPGFFRQTKYKSFLRQLNMWGFARIVGGAYFHPYFRRDRPELCHHLTRCRKAPRDGISPAINLSAQPNESTQRGLFLLNDLVTSDCSSRQQTKRGQESAASFLLPRLSPTDPSSSGAAPPVPTTSQETIVVAPDPLLSFCLEQSSRIRTKQSTAIDTAGPFDDRSRFAITIRSIMEPRPIELMRAETTPLLPSEDLLSIWPSCSILSS